MTVAGPVGRPVPALWEPCLSQLTDLRAWARAECPGTKLPAPPELAASRLQLVLVDDALDLLELLGIMLRRRFGCCCDVAAFHRPRDALEHIAAHPTLLLITDFFMPAMNGIELARVVRAQSPWTSIALVSASYTADTVGNPPFAEVDGIYAKPFYDSLDTMFALAVRRCYDRVFVA